MSHSDGPQIINQILNVVNNKYEDNNLDNVNNNIQNKEQENLSPKTTGKLNGPNIKENLGDENEQLISGMSKLSLGNDNPNTFQKIEQNNFFQNKNNNNNYQKYLAYDYFLGGGQQRNREEGGGNNISNHILEQLGLNHLNENINDKKEIKKDINDNPQITKMNDFQLKNIPNNNISENLPFNQMNSNLKNMFQQNIMINQNIQMIPNKNQFTMNNIQKNQENKKINKNDINFNLPNFSINNQQSQIDNVQNYERFLQNRNIQNIPQLNQLMMNNRGLIPNNINNNMLNYSSNINNQQNKYISNNNRYLANKIQMQMCNNNMNSNFNSITLDQLLFRAKITFPGKFFVIKSIDESNILCSIKFRIWCSTIKGNQKLQKEYKESGKKYPIILFFSVNGSGKFMGIALMNSDVEYKINFNYWSQNDKWKGFFFVNWICIKDVPNRMFKNIINELNDHKPVISSRDTQEISTSAGVKMLEIFRDYPQERTIFNSQTNEFNYMIPRQNEITNYNININNMNNNFRNINFINNKQNVNNSNNFQNFNNINNLNNFNNIKNNNFGFMNNRGNNNIIMSDNDKNINNLNHMNFAPNMNLGIKEGNFIENLKLNKGGFVPFNEEKKIEESELKKKIMEDQMIKDGEKNKMNEQYDFNKILSDKIDEDREKDSE